MNTLYIFLLLLQVKNSFSDNTDDTKRKRVCVIGAGIAGLSAARYLREEFMDFTVFEQTQFIGGVWRYDSRTGFDEYGLPIRATMYKDLRTNLPKPAMSFPGFPILDYLPSFQRHNDFFTYIHDYVSHFGLRKYIKLLRRVIQVTKTDVKWKVKYESVVTHNVYEEEFDYVIVANGHFIIPHMPKIQGENLFKGADSSGTIMHSHSYREARPYKDRRVLVIGAGPSGMDISKSIAEISTRLIHSHHRVQNEKPFPPNYVKKPDVKEFNETGAIFADGTYEDLDDIIYCTGYNFDYTFLDESCGLTLEPKALYPLYQRMVNIKEPSMFIMGLVIVASAVHAFDAQARYATALIKGNFTLPSESQMLENWENERAILSAKKIPLSFLHKLGEQEDDYYGALAAESGTYRVPKVISKIRAATDASRLINFYTFRDYEYIVIDDNTFTRRLESKNFDKKT